MSTKNVRVVICWSGKIHDIYEGDKDRALTPACNNQSLFAGLKLLISPTEYNLTLFLPGLDIQKI
jgi:hypothetical protein